MSTKDVDQLRKAAMRPAAVDDMTLINLMREKVWGDAPKTKEDIQISIMQDALDAIRPYLRQPETADSYIRTRLAQIASGDYKACGHTAEQVAADALSHMRQPADKAAMIEKMARAMKEHESQHIKGSWTGLATAAYEAEHESE